MNEPIARRISKDLGITDLDRILAEKLSGADLHSLFLAVLKQRVGKISAPSLALPSAVSKACDLDARLFNTVERIAFDVASQFDAVELSPLSPLGAVAVLTGLDQSNVLSTIRSSECASDPTIGMALECALRRKDPKNRRDTTRLCTSQRVVRYPLPDSPAFTAHFKLFSLVTAGHDAGSFSFETTALREQIGFYLSLLSELKSEEFVFEDIVVEISDTRVVAHLCSLLNIDRDLIRKLVRARDSGSADRLLAQYSVTWPKSTQKPLEDLASFDLPKHLMMQLKLLEDNVCAPLSQEHGAVQFGFNLHRLTGLGYYDGPCFHIKMKNQSGQAFMLADGGFVNWTQNLLSDGKERLMTSAIGLELMCRLFRRQQSD